jgi:hypothetical protein
MENFKLWIISFCGAGIISSLFKILVSNSNVKKSVDIFLSMFYLDFLSIANKAIRQTLAAVSFLRYLVYGLLLVFIGGMFPARYSL